MPSRNKDMRTAAEPMSLARPARAWRSKPIRSTVASMALLMSSTTRVRQHRGDEQGTLHAAVTQPHCQGYDDESQSKFLAKGGLLSESTPQAPNARTQGAHHAGWRLGA